jgi:hypothetical protein
LLLSSLTISLSYAFTCAASGLPSWQSEWMLCGVISVFGLGVFLVVLLRPLRGRFMWPFDVAGLAMSYLRTVWASKFGAPFRNPALMAFRRDDIGGLHKLWWANFTALDFVVRAYKNPAASEMLGKGGSGVQLLQGPSRDRLVVADSTAPGVVHIPSPVIGRVHRCVLGSLYPHNIILLLYHTMHFLSSNVTVHPALHNTLMPNSDAILIPGTTCPVNTVRRPGMVMLPVCVDLTLLPSGRFIVIGLMVGFIFSMGMPSITKIDVAPVSTIACNTSMSMFA